MAEILLHYTINEQTMALFPVANMDYDTVVLERERHLCIRRTPSQLIKRACLEHCSTYEGRRSAVMLMTGLKRQVPIPINPDKSLYTFPTHSQTDFHCNWLFYNHIKEITPIYIKKNAASQSLITFKNGFQQHINVSPSILKKQMERTVICIFQFTFSHKNNPLLHQE